MSVWDELVADARALKVIACQGPSAEWIAASPSVQDHVVSLVDRLEAAVQEAGEGLELLAGPRPRAVLVLSDVDRNELNVQMAFDPPLDADAPQPLSYDAAISFLEWLRERLKVAIEGGG